MKKIILFSFLLLAGCKKGDPGTPGAAGAPGNANVLSRSFTILTSMWVADNTNKLYYFNYPDSDISSAVLSGGSVSVYLSDSGGNNFSAMPFSFQISEFNYVYSLNNLQVQVSLSTGVMPSNPGTQYFKVVVIP